MDITQELFKMADKEYKAFHSKLIPTVSPDKIIGVRTPELRKYAKVLAKLPEGEDFIKKLAHTYYDENNLHAFIVEEIKDYDRAVYETERFLPYIDNWATCDMFLPKVFKKNTDKLIEKVMEWTKSDKEYTVRYAVDVLMKLYLDDNFKQEYAKTVSEIKSDKYYINMVIAWYFATALAKQYNSAIVYLTENKLDVWVHNKTIQKACESNRIDGSVKKYLRTLKRA